MYKTKIMHVIDDYTMSEFGYHADFSDKTNIGLAYTTLTDDEISIQVSIDIVNMILKTWIGDENCSDGSLEESKSITKKEIIEYGFDFDDLISGWEEYIENNKEKYAC